MARGSSHSRECSDTNTTNAAVHLLVGLTGTELIVPPHLLDLSVSRFCCEFVQPHLGVPAPFIQLTVLEDSGEMKFENNGAEI